jgi:hypothetical protein
VVADCNAFVLEVVSHTKTISQSVILVLYCALVQVIHTIEVWSQVLIPDKLLQLTTQAQVTQKVSVQAQLRTCTTLSVSAALPLLSCTAPLVVSVVTCG